MRLLARLRSWARAGLRRSKMEREMDAELRFHIERRTEDFIRDGHSSDEAVRLARAEFGGIEARKEECREALGLRLIDEVASDLRYAVRQLRHSRTFTTVAVLTLALGIGANTAIFSLMEAALWKSIPARNPEQLRMFSWRSGPRIVMNGINGRTRQTPTGQTTSTSFSYRAFLELQRQNQAFETVFAFKPIARATALIDGKAELVKGQLVSGTFYEGVGIVPILGRPIDARDDTRTTTETVALISNGFWARRFGRDPSVLGRHVAINNLPVTIVGVNPADFTGVEPGENPDVYLPLAQELPLLQRPGSTVAWMDIPALWWLPVMGRLKPGVREVDAEASMGLAFQQAVRASLPAQADRDQPTLEILSGARGYDGLSEDFRTPLLVLFSFVGVVLLIACTNIASLLLSRAAARQREISLRLALGASRWRVIRQLLTEGLTLAFFGGVSGTALGYWIGRSVPAFLGSPWQGRPFEAVFDSRVLLACLTTTIAAGVVFSIAPAWRATRIGIGASLKDSGATMFRLPRWWRGKALVLFQVGLSVLLLIATGLFVQTLLNLQAETLGFRPDHIILFNVSVAPRSSAESRKVLYDEFEQRIGAIPGVESVTLSSSALVARDTSMTLISRDGPTDPRIRRDPLPENLAWDNIVGQHFFETMDIPILYGRVFTSEDRAGSQALAVVSRQFARKFFAEDNPTGKTFWNADVAFQIIGVTGDTRFDRVSTPFPPIFYRFYGQAATQMDFVPTFAVRTALGEDSVMSAIRSIVQSRDKELPVFDVRTQVQQIDATLSGERLFAILTTAFGLIALVLSSIGIYGIMANGVAQRTNEIGIRMALGAARTRMLAMFLREALWLTGVGAALGLLAALILTRYVRSLLYGVQPIDPGAIAGAIALMIVTTLVAGWIPARRASRLEPMVALRHE